MLQIKAQGEEGRVEHGRNTHEIKDPFGKCARQSARGLLNALNPSQLTEKQKGKPSAPARATH